MELKTFYVGTVLRTEDVEGEFHLICRGEKSGLVMSWYFTVKDTRLHSATKQVFCLVYRVCTASSFTQYHNLLELKIQITLSALKLLVSSAE